MAMLRTLLLPLMLAAAGAAGAQAATQCPPAAPELPPLRMDELRTQARDRGVLWRLQKDGRTSWLYGTVHVGRPEWAVPGPQVGAALGASDVLALELDPTDPELPRLFLARGDAQREQRVLAGLQPRLERLAERACLPPQGLASLRPMLQLTTLGMTEARREGLHPEFGLDVLLFGAARAAGKEVVALESPAAQLAAMVPESEADERALLERGLDDLESGEGSEQLEGLLQAWIAGDAERLASYPQWCGCLETPAEQRFFRRLNDQRNVAIAARLAALHAGGRRVFAAVGALHMTGPQALQLLMRERGFSVTRVSFTTPERP